MSSPESALSYTSYDGASLTLYPWTGRHVALLTASNTLNPQTMAALLSGLDSAYDVYAYVTGREPSPFHTYSGLATIAEVPTTFGTNGGALGFLGFTGIELSEAVWTALYQKQAQSGQFDQAVFYELGRNFWFYGSQLGPVDPFVTGFAIVNRFISMEQAGLPGAPFNGTLDFAEFKISILEDLPRTYLSGSQYTLDNTIVAGSSVSSTHGWSAADFAASLLYQVYEDFGLDEYRGFYSALSKMSGAASSSAAIQNFLNAAQIATGVDYSFLNKAAGVAYLTGGRGADALQSGGSSPVFGFGGNDTLTGGSNADRLFGDAGNDLLLGGEGNDELVGGQGADDLRGGGGDDRIFGGAGDDVLTGNAGIDKLTGGAGVDIFKDTATDLNGDTIEDFSSRDRILISDAHFESFSFSITGHTLTYSGGSLTMTNLPTGELIASGAAGGGVQLRIIQQQPANNDFDGDHRSDILWRDDNGLLFNWLATGDGAFASNAGKFATSISTEWRVAGTGDFNGDGRVDLLWRQDVSGHLLDWLGNASGGFNTNPQNFDSAVPASVHIVATGDVNGDGNADILFRNDSGLLFDWLGQVNGGFTSNTANFATVISTEWRVIGTGDFNGDGKEDILWRQDGTGHLLDWLGTSEGGFVTNAASFDSALPLNIAFAGTGDFNGDGYDDILWRGSDGLLFDWLGDADGRFTPNTANFATVVSTEWRVISVGDFNGDGKDDILWRQDGTGHLLDWLGTANGGFVTNPQHFDSSAPASLHVQDPFL